MNKPTRRDFNQRAVLAGTASVLSAIRTWGRNERIRLGFIGLGNRGDQLLDGFLQQQDCEIAALCDIHRPYLEFATKKIGREPKCYHDYRALLEQKDVDAVVISTPDHWHALQFIHACQAGKDIYVEKPLSLTVDEGRKMVVAAGKHQRVTQVGIMRRSAPQLQEAAQLIRSGGIGKVTFARAYHVQNEWPKGIGKPSDEDSPKDFDWEAWLGPAPRVRYNKNRTFYRFRWFYDYSGGQLTNFGVHHLDMIHWSLGQDRPLAVTAMGGKFAITDNREIPDTLEVLWQYPGNKLVSFTQINTNAAPPNERKSWLEFRGTKGTLFVMNTGYEVVPDALTGNEFPVLSPLTRVQDRGYRAGARPEIEAVSKRAKDSTTAHARNFLDCIKSRQRCHCDIEVGHRATSATLIANIALKTRAHLQWDGQQEQFTNHTEANRFLSYAYRHPYKLPT